ncbi:glycosyltransferase family 2 protein [Shewanella psychropiezotolerans]|uniref:glycosyltransferase family 2 protein n=1 Tax=Shewanella psychropiezotolerans TaxID=2593655 RepID=UPI00163D99F9|nr:glycosyltransferase family 2 protein [Shewanella psychropiezotolerans]
MEEQTVQVKVSLIVTTYNWPQALRKVLENVKQLVEYPHEVIIADDGSGQETIDLINAYQGDFPCALIHSWQQDAGFRAALSRNKAIQKSSGDYIVFLDGDTMINPSFIKDHRLSAQQGMFVQGKRAYINEQASRHLLESDRAAHTLMIGLEHRDQSFRLAFLPTFMTETVKTQINRGMGGNCAFWKKDIIQANGYNIDFEGWGPEDIEFCQRLLNAGLKCKRLRFKATCFHIFHKLRSRKMLDKNQLIYQNTVSNQLTRCKNGLEQSK